MLREGVVGHLVRIMMFKVFNDGVERIESMHVCARRVRTGDACRKQVNLRTRAACARANHKYSVFCYFLRLARLSICVCFDGRVWPSTTWHNNWLAILHDSLHNSSINLFPPLPLIRSFVHQQHGNHHRSTDLACDCRRRSLRLHAPLPVQRCAQCIANIMPPTNNHIHPCLTRSAQTGQPRPSHTHSPCRIYCSRRCCHQCCRC